MGSTREINGQTYDVIEASSVIFYWRNNSDAIEYERVSVVFTGDRYLVRSLSMDETIISVHSDAVLYAVIEPL